LDSKSLGKSIRKLDSSVIHLAHSLEWVFKESVISFQILLSLARYLKVSIYYSVILYSLGTNITLVLYLLTGLELSSGWDYIYYCLDVYYLRGIPLKKTLHSVWLIE
jgi:hypothetical protein